MMARHRQRLWLVVVTALLLWLTVALPGGFALGQGTGGTPTPTPGQPSALPLGPSQPALSPASHKGIDVPTSDLSARDQCNLDAGWYIVEVHPPSWPGGRQWYEMQSDLPDDVAVAASLECSARFPSKVLTPDEVRVVYARWVGERECLIRLGYQPQEPPSEETFLEQWKTGPWMPIDGTDYTHWSDEEYQEAKRECWLEMYDR